jgi:hypothetical protein
MTGNPPRIANTNLPSGRRRVKAIRGSRGAAGRAFCHSARVAPRWRQAASRAGGAGAPRRVAAWLAAAVCLLLLAPVAADAGCGKTKRYAATADAGLGTAPLAIGDSVLLGAAVETAALGYDVDVRGCRQVAEGIAVLRKRARKAPLPRLVVVALGSNSAVTLTDVRTLLRLLGPGRLLGLVTPREVKGTLVDDAVTLRSAAARWPRRIALVDWAKTSKGARPRLTGSDGIHLTIAGRIALADMLRAPLARLGSGTVPAPPPAPGTDGGGATAP